ncbi:MAG: hypothetical protein OXL95_01145 [Nitrospira sp.]|nr:hypothetical protein [Nitrospira sp.]
MNQKNHPTRKSRQSKYDEVNDPAFKISDTPENIAKAILQKPPKQWEYLTKPTQSSS